MEKRDPNKPEDWPELIEAARVAEKNAAQWAIEDAKERKSTLRFFIFWCVMFFLVAPAIAILLNITANK